MFCMRGLFFARGGISVTPFSSRGPLDGLASVAVPEGRYLGPVWLVVIAFGGAKPERSQRGKLFLFLAEAHWSELL